VHQDLAQKVAGDLNGGAGVEFAREDGAEFHHVQC
jgi:hypothetical protein